MQHCRHCGSVLVLKKWHTDFCNRKCAAVHNNKKRIRKPWGRGRCCKKCGGAVEKWKTLCNSVECRIRVTLLSGTKGALFEACKWQSAHSYIRNNSRSVYASSDRPKACVVCGYNYHYDVCHIRPVSDFDDGAMISEINSINNLVALCPNHHWELDHGRLEGVYGLSPRTGFVS